MTIQAPSFRCAVEVKIANVALQRTQKELYSSCFVGQQKFLWFIYPHWYKHRHELPWPGVHGLTRVSHTKWHNLAQYLEDAYRSSCPEDRVFREAVEFLKWRYKPLAISSSEQEACTREARSAVLKLQRLLEDISASFQSDQLIARKPEPDGTAEYSFFIEERSTRHVVLWVGMWTKARTCLAAGVQTRENGWKRPERALPSDMYHPVEDDGQEIVEWSLRDLTIPGEDPEVELEKQIRELLASLGHPL